MAGGNDYNNSSSTAPFRVGFNGDIHSTSGVIGGFTISEFNLKGTDVGLGCSSGHDWAF